MVFDAITFQIPIKYRATWWWLAFHSVPSSSLCAEISPEFVNLLKMVCDLYYEIPKIGYEKEFLSKSQHNFNTEEILT